MSVFAYVKNYLADKTASMATQVVMFSVLLFGTSGVVLDFGRVYSEHSIMQSYTDQAALAAAAELDGSADSIDSAINAVFGGLDADGNPIGAPLSKTAVFSSGAGNDFNISHLVFLSDMANDAGAQSSMTGITSDIVYVAFANGGSNGDKATAAAEAKYVIAVAEERSVSNTLINLINSGTESAAASSNVVRTVAAATRRKNYCGEFSNLVMCSPRGALASSHPSSSSADMELGEFMEAFEGSRYLHIADNNSGTETHRLYRRHNPMLASVPALQSVCDSLAQMPGSAEGQSNGKVDQYQAICHLAGAVQRDHCIGDTLQIVRAEPEVITTALNVAFDKWDFPISEALNWEGTVLQGELALLQPDLLTYDSTRRLSGADLSDASPSSFPAASRLNYEFVGDSAYNVNIPSCFNNSALNASCGVTQPGIAPYIGNPANQSDDLQEYYEENYPDLYLHINGGLNLDNSITNFFELYLQERSEWTHASVDYSRPIPGAPATFNYTTFEWEVEEEIVPAGSALTVTEVDGSLAAYTPSPTQVAQLGDDEHANYPLPVNPDDSHYRRRMSIPMVNCDNIDFDPTTGVAEVEVLEFVDMYLLQPPRAFCSDSADGTMCNNADVASASVFTEFVEKSTYIETEYPELVR